MNEQKHQANWLENFFTFFEKKKFSRWNQYKSCMLLLVISLCASMASLAADIKVPTECSDPMHYNARDWSVAELQKRFAECDPADADMWYGKKDRLSLNGIWKTRLIDLPRDDSKPTMCPAWKQNGKMEVVQKYSFPESDLGEKKGFFRENYDDSKWFNTILPCLATVPLEGLDGSGMCFPFLNEKSHEVWYRRNFTLPEDWIKNKRLVLTINHVAYRADVYLNGKKVGGHASLHGHNWYVFTRASDESFQIDLTGKVKPGKNVIAIKVYSPYEFLGIPLPLYIDATPKVAATKILVTPNRKNKTVELRAFMVNETGHPAIFSPSVELEPWKSKDYTIANWKAEKTVLQKFTVPPGKSEWSTVVPVKQIHYWSMEEPLLYHLILKNGKEIAGQERFGFRNITVGENAFFLNGIPVFFRGEATFLFERFAYRQFAFINRKNNIRKLLLQYKEHGYNAWRAGYGLVPEVYRRICDEVGIGLFSIEESDPAQMTYKNGKVHLSPAQKEGVIRLIHHDYNNPSMLLRSGKGDAYVSHLKGSRWEKIGYAPIHDALYDIYKHEDPTRPYVSSTGRHTTKHNGPFHTEKANAKSDFDDDHDYCGTYEQLYLDNLDAAWSNLNSKKWYTKASGVKRAYVLGEYGCYFASCSMMQKRPWCAKVSSNLKDGAYNRKWLAKNGDSLNDHMKIIIYACWVPRKMLATNFQESANLRGRQEKMLLEVVRRNKGHIAGSFIMSGIFDHDEWPSYLAGGPRPIRNELILGDESLFSPPCSKWIKMAQQPILAVADGRFPYDLITGAKIRTAVILMNETMKTLPPSKIEITICEKSLATLDAPELKPNGMKKISLSYIVPDLESGKKTLGMKTVCNGKTLSINEYPVFILNRKDICLPEKKRTPLCLLGNNYSIRKALDRLGLKYTVMNKGMPSKDTVAIYSAATSGKQAKKLLAWVQAGGKALMLEPDALPSGFPGNYIGPKSPDAVEIALPQHPVFKGLDDEDFIFWNFRKKRELFKQAIYPMNESVLAFKEVQNLHTAMVMGEGRFGKGRIFFSQLLANRLFGSDSKATRYLMNVYDYVTGGFDDPNAPQLALSKNKHIRSFDTSDLKAYPIDLRKFVNWGLHDRKARDHKGGWDDDGPWPNDGSCFKPGILTTAGIPFRIIDEKKNNGKACFVLKGGPKTWVNFLPASTEEIPVNRKVRKLYFLLTSKWTPKNETFANIEIIKTTQGIGVVSKQVVPIVGWVNVGDWWYGGSVSDAANGPSFDSGSGHQYQSYVVEWVDPEPQNPVSTIQFSSTGKNGCPIIIAVTAMEENK